MSELGSDFLSEKGKAEFTSKWCKAGEVVVPLGKSGLKVLSEHFPEKTLTDGSNVLSCSDSYEPLVE